MADETNNNDSEGFESSGKARDQIGPYEVVAPLGAGGMGEVYRARDTKLDRDVALKVLPEAFTSDSDRLARFQREAKVLASLNHPNIAQIHGLEESGDSPPSSSNTSKGRHWPTASRRVPSRSTRPSPSPGRSPERSKRLTSRASSTAT